MISFKSFCMFSLYLSLSIFSLSVFFITDTLLFLFSLSSHDHYDFFFMVIIIIVGLIDRLSLLFISIKIFIDLFFGSVKQLPGNSSA